MQLRYRDYFENFYMDYGPKQRKRILKPPVHCSPRNYSYLNQYINEHVPKDSPDYKRLLKKYVTDLTPFDKEETYIVPAATREEIRSLQRQGHSFYLQDPVKPVPLEMLPIPKNDGRAKLRVKFAEKLQPLVPNIMDWWIHLPSYMELEEYMLAGEDAEFNRAVLNRFTVEVVGHLYTGLSQQASRKAKAVLNDPDLPIDQWYNEVGRYSYVERRRIAQANLEIEKLNDDAFDAFMEKIKQVEKQYQQIAYAFITEVLQIYYPDVKFLP